jgi:DEP domain-containing protein 5
MSTNTAFRTVQKVCTLWTHDPGFSVEDVVFNLDKFQELGLSPGSLAQIVAVRQGTAVRDFQEVNANGIAGERTKSPFDQKSNQKTASASRRNRSGSLTTTFDENGVQLAGGKDVEAHRAYVFVTKDASPDLKSRHPGLQVSISQTIAHAFGFRNRTQVIVATADESAHSASHVEISFKDEYLSRADMWRLAISELSQKTVYRDQRILFLGTIKATVKNVWINGQKKRSGYFSTSTKPVFRSESARYVLFIQMSKEMWEFDSEGSGEIMFNKVINGFLPELFKNWMSLNAHHLVTIVLFSRLEYDDDFGSRHILSLKTGRLSSESMGPRDFYRVVVSDMASADWVTILWQLKKEFRTFLRDISVQPVHVEPTDGSSFQSAGSASADLEHLIVGRPTISAKGNILEAINLASSQFARDHIDRDLVRTGISVVVITAGTGVCEVDYGMLKLTTDTLIGSGIGIDLVCLSPMPLHSVPLFKYRNPRLLDDDIPGLSSSPSFDPGDSTPRQFRVGSMSSKSFSSTPTRFSKGSELEPGEWSYAMPHWIDVSFWRGTADEQAMLIRQKKPRKSLTKDRNNKGSEFAVRCRMYELQMMGVMENEMTNIVIPHLHNNAMHPWHKIRPQMTGRPMSDNDRSRITKWERDWMEDYDDILFRPLHQRRAAAEKARDEARRANPALGEASRLKPYSDHMGVSGGSFRPGTGYLEWKLKDRCDDDDRTPTKVSVPKASTVSLTSTAVSIADSASIKSSTSRPSRQISFGGAGFATPKAVASTVLSTGVTTTTESVLPTILSDNVEVSPAQGLSKLALQIRAAWSRKPSQQTIPRPESRASETERPSKPINIGTIRPLADHSRSSSGDLVVGSEAGVGGTAREDHKSPHTSPTKVHDSGAILYAASNARKLPPRHDLASSGDKHTIPQKLSPTSAISPWLVLVNPCNPKKNTWDINSQFRRWQHVFPRPLRTASMKWKSLCSPASVPLTNDYFPTAEQLATEYEESPYRLSQNTDDELSEAPPSREALIREMIAFRLAHGYQFVVGSSVSDFLGSHTTDLVNIFDKDYMAKEGATVFMSVGNSIHQLLCTASGEIEVRRFKRKPPAAVDSSSATDEPTYRSYIRTFLESSYELREVGFKKALPDYNWNYIDTFLAGYHDDFSETLRFWRARFVLIPVDIPHQGRRPLPMLTEDSPEEIRLEGIRKLTQIWQRHRVIPPEEKTYQSMHKRKDPNPLAIEYQTRDPSSIIAAGSESVLLTDTDSMAPPSSLFSESETYSTTNYDLKKLAQELQGERGIKMIDRRWHWRLHYHCFVGFDLTTWLLDRFRDIEGRDDAVAFGNELMNQGLFQHTSKRHAFRDGQYFYQLASEYRTPRPDSRTSWFGSRRVDRSVPATPMTEVPRTGRPDTSSSSDRESEKTPTMRPVDSARRKFVLSHAMKYDIDPRKRSYRPEIINLHYDRLHNPDNCYHIRIDWMNATSKFIEDAIGHWAMSVERYGLKLVEVPLAEAAAITETHPFRSPFLVKLALRPPAAPSLEYFDATSFTPQARQDQFAYHKLLLKKMGFVLDVEAASSFPPDVDVTYSWGRPDYKYTQYIHKSGVVLAQITHEGHFFLLANRLYNNRSFSARDSGRFDSCNESHHERPRPSSAQGFHGHGHSGSTSHNPLSSPVPRPVSETFSAPPAKFEPLTAEEIKEELEALCYNKDALMAFYDEARRQPPNPSPSPRLTPTIETTVPSLKLPPSIASIRDSSPSPAPSWTTGSSSNTASQANKAGGRNNAASQG